LSKKAAMRANFKLQRLYIDTPLASGETVAPGKEQIHYLMTVLRMDDGARVLVFNGRDGEFLAALRSLSKKAGAGDPRADAPAAAFPRLDFLFAPLKVGRLDYLVQKATEMGVRRITPVFTDHTQLHKVNASRLQANILEAAEQCGNLAVPSCSWHRSWTHCLRAGTRLGGSSSAMKARPGTIRRPSSRH
jgi:16S rRNA (uracil1498-N3)-methyltransferase